MTVHADKLAENKNGAFANQTSDKSRLKQFVYGFTDNRSETVSRQKLHDLANHNIQINRAAQLKSIANNYIGRTLAMPENENKKSVQDKNNSLYRTRNVYNKENLLPLTSEKKPAISQLVRQNEIQPVKPVWPTGNNMDLTIQNKKTEPHEGFAKDGHHALIPFHPALSLLEKGAPQEVQDRRIFDIVELQYNSSLEKGRQNWGKLHESLLRYHLNREELVTELTLKREQYQQKWQENYETKLKNGAGNGALSMTYGKIGGNGIDKGKLTGRGYQNTMYLESNTISAEANYANDDPARLANVGLNNSEILWQQYLMAVRAKNNIFEDSESRSSQKMAELSGIVRKNLQNPVVQKVVYFCYPNGQYWNSDKSWTSDKEEFFALLGTPNIAAAIYLLIDHMDELGGKTIERIETTADQNINIIFGSLPEQQKIEQTLINFSPALWSKHKLPETDLGRDNPLMQNTH